MTEQVPHRDTDRWLEPGALNVKAVYVLYLAGLVVGITGIAGIVIATINRGKSEPWIETHYTWAIRTFWIGLLYALVSAMLMLVAIGFITGLLTVGWFIARIVHSWQALDRGEPMGNPASWNYKA